MEKPTPSHPIPTPSTPRTASAPRITLRAIVTYARGWNALAIVRSLGAHGVDVIAGDERPFAPAALSRHTRAAFLYPNPERDPEGFLAAIEAQVRRHRPAQGELVIMPVHKETYLVARHRARFEALGARLALPDEAQIAAVSDKGTLALTCARLGVPMARTLLPTSADDLPAVAATLRFPAFVKLRDAAAAVGVIKVDDGAALERAWRGLCAEHALGPDALPIVQEGVPGDDYCATFLFEHGALRAAMTYHNLRSFPAGSGTGVLRETVAAPEIERIGAELLGKLGWHGVAEIDFRWDGGAGTPELIEVNPRFWGGLAQSVASGWDYPWLLYRLAVDGRVESVLAHASDVRTEAPVMGALATLYEITHGRARSLCEDLRRTRALLGDHDRARSDVFSFEDPLPALGVLYPLGVFLRHGRVSTALLVSEGSEGRASPSRAARRRAA